MRNRRVWSIQSELIEKARESALAAVKIFNDPLIKFKSESFIVLMVIAWTYLLHGYYRSKKIDYRYFSIIGKRKKYDKTKRGAYKYWELERCLNDKYNPIDKDTSNNLRFLIGLRHEIEHQMTSQLDDFLSGRYQACILNFNSYIKKLFADSYSLDKNLTFSLQFIEFSEEQILGGKPDADIPENLKAFIVEFDGILNDEEYNSEKYSYRLIFSRKLANNKGQADKVVEFIDPKSELGQTFEKEYWIKKEVEKVKYRPKSIVSIVKARGFLKFSVNKHTDIWKSEDAKNLKKGFGANIEGTWFWYETWLERVIVICTQSGSMYK
jgi:Protein of unknown function (DUF3644)